MDMVVVTRAVAFASLDSMERRVVGLGGPTLARTKEFAHPMAFVNAILDFQAMIVP